MVALSVRVPLDEAVPLVVPETVGVDEIVVLVETDDEPDALFETTEGETEGDGDVLTLPVPVKFADGDGETDGEFVAFAELDPEAAADAVKNGATHVLLGEPVR